MLNDSLRSLKTNGSWRTKHRMLKIFLLTKDKLTLPARQLNLTWLR